MGTHTTDKNNPLVVIKEFADDGVLQVINSYGDGGFRIAKTSYDGHQLVLPRQTISWPVSNINDISLASLDPVLTADPVPEIILFGLGATPQSPLFELRQMLQDKGIKSDIMSTASACRTWNILLTEGRAAAAALLAVE